MSQSKETVWDIFLGAVSRKVNGAKPLEICDFILHSARENDYNVRSVGQRDTFKIDFPTGEAISFDGRDLHIR